jgi:Fur family ferric uptake transcriptional regulator
MTGTRGTKMADAGTEALQGRLSEHMDKRGLRSTSQRRLVAEVFFRSDGHLSIDEMLALVRKRDPKVGYATVYRTMKLLVQSGVANERQFGDSVTRFEIAHGDQHHDHLICIECGAIVEFEDAAIERLQDAIAERHGFTLERHKHELYGVCRDCRKT